MANLMVMQDRQMADLILKQKTDKHSRESRRRAKIFRKKQVQQIKIKDILMTHQERASKANKLAKTDLAHSIAKFNSHLEAVGKKHAVKISKKESAQERRISNWQKLLNVELDSVERYVNQDEKRDMTKATQFKINHQKAVDKLELEQLRELNDLEITCIRRTADLNNKKMDSDNNFELKNLDSIRESEVTHNAKILDQKSKINDIRIKIKETIADIDDDMEMKRMKIVHQNQKIRLMNQHSQQYSTSTKKWSKTLGHNISKEPEIIPVASSDDDIVLQADADLTRRLKELKESMQEEEQILLKLKEKYQETCAEFKLKSKESREVERENHQSELVELELNQDILFRNLRNTHQYHIQELLKVQRHELFMDQNMRELDVKAMFERRILNTLLDTIADGVINITPTGTITRFNAAAEKMFKAKASSAIGTNIRNYMPHEHSINHDEYLYNYLTTERPKVIGIGRDTFGKTIQGEIFPIHLSVSEVKGEGYHLFNGIATDLTEQVRAKKKIADEEDRKRREQQVLIDELAVYQKRSTNLLQQMLPLDFAQRIMSGETPPPQNYKTSTIFFSDIVGFTSIASACTAMDIVNLLNDLYTYFDAVIDRHGNYI